MDKFNIIDKYMNKNMKPKRSFFFKIKILKIFEKNNSLFEQNNTMNKRETSKSLEFQHLVHIPDFGRILLLLQPFKLVKN